MRKQEPKAVVKIEVKVDKYSEEEKDMMTYGLKNFIDI